MKNGIKFQKIYNVEEKLIKMLRVRKILKNSNSIEHIERKNNTKVKKILKNCINDN